MDICNGWSSNTAISNESHLSGPSSKTWQTPHVPCFVTTLGIISRIFVSGSAPVLTLLIPPDIHNYWTELNTLCRSLEDRFGNSRRDGFGEHIIGLPCKLPIPRQACSFGTENVRPWLRATPCHYLRLVYVVFRRDFDDRHRRWVLEYSLRHTYAFTTYTNQEAILR